nr:MAG TPA: hypothetical protein [Caudoviricetes sp.]
MICSRNVRTMILTAGTRWLDRRTLMRFNIDFFSLLCYNLHKIIFAAKER